MIRPDSGTNIKIKVSDDEKKEVVAAHYRGDTTISLSGICSGKLLSGSACV